MASATRQAPPEQGQLVEVRGQKWVVSRAVPAPDTRPGAGDAPSTTLLHLQSVADGRFGDTLAVIWEVEPGRRVLPAGSLPEVTPGTFDPPERLAAFLDAVRWSSVASADTRTLQAPFRSGVAVEPYQLEPVVRAVRAPRVNLLLADDVGLGKTIEAGLVIQELILRTRAHRIMVVCPAGLTLKWRDELSEKFGLDFTIVNSQHCAALRRTHGTAANPFRVHPRTIVSLPWLRGDRARRLLDEVVPTGAESAGTDGTPSRFFHLLVLDEAHHVAPSAPKQLYAVDSQQTKLIRRLVPHFEHRLFLSATPHNGYRESYTALLELIDDQRFARGVPPDKAALDATVVRRLKRDITNEDGTPRFRHRDPRRLEVDYTDAERQAHALLTRFAALRREHTAPRPGRDGRGARRAADLVTLLLKKRLFSSPAAFLHTVRSYLAHLDGTRGARRAAPGAHELVEDYRTLSAVYDDDTLTDFEDDALIRASTLTPTESGDELALLREMEAWALTHEAVADSKARELISAIRGICLPDGRWNSERLVVFTEYRDTQDWLRTLLEQDGMAENGRLQLLHGGLPAAERERIRLGFQTQPGRDHEVPEARVRVLLATDAAGEGIDLQNYCHRLFNYDIPFNPNRIEQRIGRIDRWGQRHDPQVSIFIGSGWQNAAPGSYEADLEFLSRVAEKVARMEADLGSVNAVLSEDVQRHMSGDLRPLEAIAKARVKKIPGRETGGNVAAEQQVTEQSKRLANQYQETVEALGITPRTVKRVVDTALAVDHQPPLRAHGSEDFDDDVLWDVPQLSGSWVRATLDLPHKLRPEERRPVTFSPEAAATARDDVVLAHLKHPLVAMSTGLLTAAVWNTHRSGLSRVTAVVSDDPRVETTLVSAFTRYVLLGSDGTRLHEQILHAGGWFGDTGRFRRWDNVNQQRELLDHALDTGTAASPHLCAELARKWEGLRKPLYDSLARRAADRRDGLERELRTRHDEEQHRITATLDRFEHALRARLRAEYEDEDAQPVLFGEHEVTGMERAQYLEDRARWHSRLAALPAERERELVAVTARYRDPQPHSFPVAVVFVIPQKEAAR